MQNVAKHFTLYVDCNTTRALQYSVWRHTQGARSTHPVVQCLLLHLNLRGVKPEEEAALVSKNMEKERKSVLFRKHFVAQSFLPGYDVTTRISSLAAIFHGYSMYTYSSEQSSACPQLHCAQQGCILKTHPAHTQESSYCTPSLWARFSYNTL